MKILLREYNGEHYVYKDAKYTKNGFEIDGNRIVEAQILSIPKDNRKAKYDKCSVCGALFTKGSTKWEKHITPVQDASKCIECHHMNRTNSTMKSTKYKLMPNGKYLVTQKHEAKLVCTAQYYGWNYPDVNSDDARAICIYNRCRNAEKIPFTDFFTEHPGAFDEMITVDKILDNGYTEMRRSSGGMTKYKLKAKNSITALVNRLNIVDRFEVSYRNSYYILYYSKKYDKLYVSYNGRYGEWVPYGVPSTTIERIKDKIKSLYE